MEPALSYFIALTSLNMKPKIGIITLGVKDVKTSAEFYKKLGFEVVGEEGDHVMFKMEWTQFALFPADKLAEDADLPHSEFGPGRSSFTLARNESSQEKVNETIEEARSIGAKILKEPQDVFWGGYSGYFEDPDGFLWEIAYNPFQDLS